MRFRGRDRLEFHVELSPLIDVVFLLLIFFMVTTTFREDSGIPIDLPESRSRVEAAPGALRLEVTRAGDVFLEGRRVGPEEIESQVHGILEREPERPVTVSADGGARHGVLVKVYEALRAAGARGFSIETRTAPEPSPGPGSP